MFIYYPIEKCNNGFPFGYQCDVVSHNGVCVAVRVIAIMIPASNGYPLNRGWPRPRGDVRRAGVSP